MNNEPRRVLPIWNFNADAMRFALGDVIFFKTPAQPVRFDPDDRVLLGVEIRQAPESLNPDCVFLDLIALPLEGAFAHVGQKTEQMRSTVEDARRDQSLKLLPFFAKLSRR